MKEHRLTTPLRAKDITPLQAGDKVLLNGWLHTARDAAHQRLCALLDQGLPLPFDPKGAAIYYVGPTPPPLAKPGEPSRPIGSAGPTTSGRMDPFAPRLYALGVKATIGKGRRSAETMRALVEHEAVYLGATGGAGALLSLCIKEAEIAAFPELGPEAVYRLRVEDFPTLVIGDAHGGNLYENYPT